MKQVFVPVAAAMLLLGCSTTPPPSVCTGQLCGAFDVVEVTDSNERIAVPTEAHLVDVDYQSRLSVQPKRDALKALSGMDENLLAPRPEAVTARLSNLDELLTQAKAYIEAAKRAGELATSAAKTKTAGDRERARAAIGAMADLGKPLLAVVETIARERAKQAGLSSDDAIDERVGALTDGLLTNDAGDDVLLNVERFADFLNEEVELLSAVRAADEVAASAAGTTRLRIRAYLVNDAGGTAAIHVANYDDIEDARPPKRPRIALRMTEEEQKRVNAEYQLARDAAALIREIKVDANKLGAGLNAIARALRDDVERLASKLAALPEQVVAQPLLDGLRKAIDKSSISAEEKTSVSDAIDRLEKSAEVVKGFKAAVAKLESELAAGNLTGVVGNLANLANDVRNALETFAQLPSDAALALQVARKLAKDLEGTAGAAAVVTALKNALTSSAQAADAFIADSKSYLDFIDKVRAAAGDAAVVDLGASLKDPGPTAGQRALAVDSAPAGEVALSDTAADEGSRLHVKLELVSGPLEDEERLQEATLSYDVQRFGFTSDFNAGLIFVKRIGDGALGDPNINFDPAPSLSWTLRYASRDCPFWNGLGFGLGLGVAGLDFTDSGPQVGTSLELSLFRGILYGGLGLNLQVEDDRGYGYLGIGILETAQAIF